MMKFFSSRAYVLLCLSMDPPFTMAEISLLTGLKKRMIYYIVDDLYEMGLVTKFRMTPTSNVFVKAIPSSEIRTEYVLDSNISWDDILSIAPDRNQLRRHLIEAKRKRYEL